jgi:hypothetical protein
VPSSSYHVLVDTIVYPVIALGVALTTALPVFLQQRFCLPVLNGLVIFPLFAWALRAGRPRRALGLGLFWALCQSLAIVAASLLMADRAGTAILGALEFRTQWLAWIASGSPVTSTPALSLPGQVRELAVFAAGSLLTGGLGGLILLAMALNAFNFTVASLLQQALRPVLLLLAAWPIWSVVRLIGYLTVGAVLAEPVAVLDLRPQWWAAWWPRRRRLLATGLGLIVLGIVLQIVLSPLWPSLLRSATGLN